MNDSNATIGEQLVQIPANRTLIAKKFTIEDATKPDVVHELQTVEQVFDHYRPVLRIRFEDAEGFTQMESLRFNALEDFALNSIVRQSDFLTRQLKKKQCYLKLAKAIQTNPVLNAVLADADKRKALQGLVTTMINDLKNSK